MKRTLVTLLAFMTLFAVSTTSPIVHAEEDQRLKEIIQKYCAPPEGCPEYGADTPKVINYSDDSSAKPKTLQVTPSESWIERNWQWLAASAGILVVGGFGFGLWRINSNLKHLKHK